MSIADGYGQAETNIVVANLADGAVKPAPSAAPSRPPRRGHRRPGQRASRRHRGRSRRRGRPPTLFAGYWELPEETKSAFLGDWYLTGDVAHVDEEGYFTFVGRAEDVITSSGRTFGPYDVERVLDGHPAIARTAVVGIRDLQRGGHFVRAFVVPRVDAGGGAARGRAPPVSPRRRSRTSRSPRDRLRRRAPHRRLEDQPPRAARAPARRTAAVGDAADDRGRRHAPTPAPPALDGEFSPRVEEPAEPEPPVAFVQEPEPVVIEPVVRAVVEPTSSRWSSMSQPNRSTGHRARARGRAGCRASGRAGARDRPRAAGRRGRSEPVVEPEPEPEVEPETEPEPEVVEATSRSLSEYLDRARAGARRRRSRT